MLLKADGTSDEIDVASVDRIVLTHHSHLTGNAVQSNGVGSKTGDVGGGSNLRLVDSNFVGAGREVGDGVGVLDGVTDGEDVGVIDGVDEGEGGTAEI